MAPVYESVLDAIGGTPLFRLANLGRGLPAPVYAKAEFLSVGGSVKDRAALAMVEQAERDGLLRPGGTIVEATSGNTGIGLAIVGRQRGYRVVIAVSDGSAQEKVDILRAYGAEVVIGSSSLPKEHPDHLFNLVRRMADEMPGAWLANQYDNPANPDAHVRTTGPEIWSQTQGRVTHFVAGIGTGGTISGTGRFLKDVSGGVVTIVGADPENSVYAGGDGSPYYVESIGHFVHPDTAEDTWPESFHVSALDRFERISDRESLLTARRLASEEGLLAGPSSGTAIAAALRVAADLGPSDLVVVLLPDSGRSYLSKVFSDDWLRSWGFLDEPADRSRAVGDVLGAQPLAIVDGTATVARTLDLHGAGGPALVVLPRPGRQHGITASEVLGSISPARLADGLAAGRIRAGDLVTAHMDSPPLTVGIGEAVADALRALGAAPVGPDAAAFDVALVLRDGRAHALITRAQLAAALSVPV
jgi:cystathionine beta-synthase